MKKIIYDFGCNNGDDIHYYLKKCDLVVAVEANPRLCDHVRNIFKTEIANSRVIVENCVLNIDQTQEDVDFYFSKIHHALSQFPEPNNLNEFHKAKLPSKYVIDIIKQYGEPYYIKIDIEHFDQFILKEILTNQIYPPYISSESHSIEIFANLIALGNYNSFKLVDGPSVPMKYRECDISTDSGIIKHNFFVHCAGPFGEDIHGPWMNRENFFKVLSRVGLGWKDIHATNIHDPDPSFCLT